MAVAVTANSAASETRNCRDIVEALERLACYDAQNEPRESAGEQDEASPAEPVVREPAVPGDVADQQTPVTPGDALEPQQQAEDSKKRKRGLFGDEIIDLTTEISSVRKGDRQKMVFLLANGEIWMQTEPRLLPLYDGDVVTIGNAMMGGYLLRTEKGVVTRVQRIAGAQP